MNMARPPLRLIPPGKHPGLEQADKPGSTDNPDIRTDVAVITGRTVLPLNDPRPAEARGIVPPKAPVPDTKVKAEAPSTPTTSSTFRQMQEPQKTRLESTFGRSLKELQSEGVIADNPMSTLVAKMFDGDAEIVNADLKAKMDNWIIETLVELNTLNQSFTEVRQAFDQFETEALFNFKDWQEATFKAVTIKSFNAFLQVIGLNEAYVLPIVCSEIEKLFGRSKQIENAVAAAELKKDNFAATIIDQLNKVHDILKRSVPAQTLVRPSSPYIKDNTKS